MRLQYYDYIIIDTPPVTRVVDTLILGKTVRNAILVVRPNHSFKEGVKWGIDELTQANIKIHGLVINAAEIKESSYQIQIWIWIWLRIRLWENLRAAK